MGRAQNRGAWELSNKRTFSLPRPCSTSTSSSKLKIPRAAAYGSTARRAEPISSASHHQDPSNCWDPDHWARGNWTPIGPRSLWQFIAALILHEEGPTGTPPNITRRYPGSPTVIHASSLAIAAALLGLASWAVGAEDEQARSKDDDP